jgi:hypothetical protein
VAPFRFANTPQRTTPLECGEHHERAAHYKGQMHAPPSRPDNYAILIQGPAEAGPYVLRAEAGPYLLRWTR